MKNLELEFDDTSLFEDVDPTPLFDAVDVPVDPFQSAIDRVVNQVFQSEPAVDREYQESVWEAMDFDVPDMLEVDDHYPGGSEYDGRSFLEAKALRDYLSASSVDQSLPDAPLESDPEIKE